MEKLGKRGNGQDSLTVQKVMTKAVKKSSRGERWPEAEGAGDADGW